MAAVVLRRKPSRLPQCQVAAALLPTRFVVLLSLVYRYRCCVWALGRRPGSSVHTASNQL